jgi:hypothetical protein
MTLISGQRSIFEIVGDCAPVPEARDDDSEIARGVVAFVRWVVGLLEEEERRLQAAEARRQRIAAKLRQVDMADAGPTSSRARIPADSTKCGQPTTCRVIGCKWNAVLDYGEPETFDGYVLRPVILNTGRGDLGRRPAFNVEDQATASNWEAFGEQVLDRLDELEELNQETCCDRVARRVRAAVEEAEDRDDWLALASLDDLTTVAIGKVLGVSDESIRLTSRSAEEKLRNMARDGGYSQDGDVSDLAEAILFGASE